MITRWMAAAAAGALLLAAGPALADDEDETTPPFTGVVVFGDSLSDAGNVGIVSGLGPVSFTTNPGDTAVEVIANHYGFDIAPSLLGGTDYAWGGAGIFKNAPGTPAGIPTITQQVDARLAAGALDPNALYTFLGGANDIFHYSTLAGAGLISPTEALAAMTPTAQGAITLIDRLQNAGAETIVVFNLPNIGRTPQAISQGPGATLLLRGMTDAFNTTLNNGLAGRHGIVPVNLNLFVSEVFDNPLFYGIDNITGRSCTTSSSITCNGSTLTVPGADEHWFFADGVHPTTAAHQLTADLVISELQAPMQMSLLPESALLLTRANREAVQQELLRSYDDPETGFRIFGTSGYGLTSTNTQLLDVPETDGEAFYRTLGFHLRPSESWSAGLAFSLGRNSIDWADDRGEFDTDVMLGSAFVHWGDGEGFFVDAQASVAKVDYTVRRQFVLGDGQRTELSHPDGWSYGARLAGGYWFGNEAWRAGPVASIDWQRVDIDSFAEHGGSSTAMIFGDMDRESAVGEIGLMAQGRGERFRPYAGVFYGHEFESDRQVVTAGLVTMNGTFDMPGYKPEENWFGGSIGASTQITDMWGVVADWTGRFGEDDRSVHLFSVGVIGRF